MKYESNVLKRLIDTYGVIGNPKYMSEVIKQFIVQGKECFPHLFTYQADWLAHIDEFGLTSDYVVSYTGQQIYAPHSKEKPVKTVDLTIKDQNNEVVNCLATFKGGTHFYTTSQVGSLKPMIEVDVVTDLAETLNLCSLDGNTM